MTSISTSLLLSAAFVAPAVASAQVLPPAAAAQTTSGPSPAAADTGVADITVTAERRSSSVQKTPLAISAVSGENLQKQQVVNLEGLSARLAGVSFSRSGTDARIYIRGIGIDAVSPGQDARVALYTDGVYNARTQAVLGGFYDIERVEVLRGPQGTLYGRNATAGAINIISRDPGDSFNGYGTLTVGDYGLVRTEGAIGGPLSETVSARIAFQTGNRNGYGRNIQTGGDVDDERTRSVRAKLLFEPSSGAKFTLQGDYHKQDDHNGGYHFIRDYPGRQAVSLALSFAIPDSIRDYAGQGPASIIESYGTSLTGVFDLGGAELTSISAYRHLTSRIETTADETTSNYIPTQYGEGSNQYSQELRVAYETGPVKLVAGAYYFNEKNSAVTSAQISGAFFGLGTDALFEGARYGGSQKTDAYALFSQATVTLTDRLGIDLGLRYSNEKRSTTGYNQFDLTRLAPATPALLPGLFVPITGRKHYNSLDPKVTVHYDLGNALLYATYSRGFKSGGFNIGFPQPPFDPEKITDYEGGIKADFFGRRLRTNLSAFWYDYSQLQVNVTEGVQLITRNAGKARIYGAEAEITALPVEDLKLTANLAWLHANYTNYVSGDPANVGLGNLDLSGNQLSNAPKYRVEGEIGYTFHSRIGDITPRADASWTSRIYFDQFNLRANSQSAYTLVNLFLDYDAGHGWSANAFVKNLTKELYVVSGTVSAAFIGYQIVGQVGAPRTYGVSVTKRF